MSVSSFVRRLALIGALGIATAACAGDRYRYGGVGFVGGYGDYYGGGYGNAGFGWHDGFYYPGNGYYDYDRDRRPYRWNDGQRRYWEGRRGLTGREARANWRDFRRDRRGDVRDYRADRRGDRAAFRNGQVDRQQFRAERRDDRRAFNRELRQDRRQLRRENRRDRRD